MGEIAKMHSPRSPRSTVHQFHTSHDHPRVLSVLSSLLERMVAKNDHLALFHGQRLTVFHGQTAPSISVEQYVERIFKYANCSPSCFVVAYAYLDRFIHQQPDMPITSLNVHRLLITSIMVAAKFLDDSYYNNAYYAKVGGVNTQEINRLELEFLFRLGFRLHVTLQVFDSYCTHLEREVASYHVERALKEAAKDASSASSSVKPQIKSSYSELKLSNNILESVS